MLKRIASAYIAGFLLISISSLTANAQTCGDTVTGHVTLTGDLLCSQGHGLLMENGGTLDCDGHTMVGAGEPGQYGIYVREVSDVTVKNCRVEHFEVGIRLRGAASCAVQNNTAQNNTRYGIEVTQSSTGTLIQGNTVYNNSDEGIHVSGPTEADALHQIVNNTIDNNALEGIYLLDSDGNTVAGNLIQHQGTAGIYMSASHRNSIMGNTLTNDSIQLVSGSQLNVLRDNTIIGERIKLDGVSNNEVYTMTVQEQGGRPSNAYELNNASNNVIVDSAAIEPIDYHIRAANQSKGNVFARFTAVPDLQCFVDKKSSVTVTDPGGNELECGRSRGGGNGGGGGSEGEKRCNDGKDNDGDGAADCQDSDCSGKAGCP